MTGNYLKEFLADAKKLEFPTEVEKMNLEEALEAIKSTYPILLTMCSFTSQGDIDALTREELAVLKDTLGNVKQVCIIALDTIAETLTTQTKQESYGDLESLSREQLLDIIKKNLKNVQ